MTLAEISRKANELMNLHGLTQKGWSFKFDHAVRRLGCCKHSQRLITMSRSLSDLNKDSHAEKLVDTLLHEIAHALTRERYGRGVQAHGWEWKRMCIEIGANPERCYDASKIETVQGKYVYVCPNCGQEVNYHKRLTRKRACSKCCNEYNSGRYSEEFIFELVD